MKVIKFIQLSMVMKIQYILLIFNIFVLIINKPTVTTDDDNHKLIYGVRWFLAESFQHFPPITITINATTTPTSDLALFFNSYSHDQTTYFVKIAQTNYSCDAKYVKTKITSNHHKDFNELASEKGSQFQITVYKCFIKLPPNTLTINSEIQYQIFITTILNQTRSIFESSFRSPSYHQGQLSIPVFGDWGIMTNFSKQSSISSPINPCLQKQIEQDQNIRLIVLLGDLAYDLQGQSYIKFFEQLEQFSQKIVILYTPGNHESIKHEDLFYVYKESFYSPYWAHFFGYFDLVSIGQVVFLGYDAQNVFSKGLARDSHTSLYNQTLKQTYGEFYNLFTRQLNPQRIAQLRDQIVISYSHYPIQCSQEDQHESCSQYSRLQRPYTDTLLKLGLDLSFSAHMHYYERSQQMCFNPDRREYKGRKFDEKADVYELRENCAVFILEGAAGNNYYVQTQNHIPLKESSRAFIANTGFGLLTLKQKTSNQKIHFRHITAAQCKTMDEMILVNKIQSIQQAPNINDDNGINIVIMLLLGLAGLILLVCLVRYIFRKLNSNDFKQRGNLVQKSHEKTTLYVDLQLSQ